MAETDYPGMVQQANRLVNGGYGGMNGAASGFLNNPTILQGLEGLGSYVVPDNPAAFGMNMLPMGRMPRPVPTTIASRAEPDMADQVTQWLRDNPLPAPRNPREAAQLSAMRATDQMRRQMGVTANTESGRSLDELLRTIDEAIKGVQK